MKLTAKCNARTGEDVSPNHPVRAAVVEYPGHRTKEDG